MNSSNFFKLKRLAIFLSVLMIVGGIFSYVMAEEPSATTSLIVKMVSGLTPQEQSAVISSNGGTEVSSIPALRLHVIEVPTSDLSTIIQNYQNDPKVVSVEENKERKAEGEPSDTDYGSQWALPKIGWDQVFGTITPTGSTTVAILDTGVDASHGELAGKLITCNSILDGSDCTSDPHGHGTWLSGIIAANTDNNNGIAGVGYAGVKIMPVTVLGADGTGQDSDIIAGVIWAADHGADIILMGFSNPGFSQNLQDAIDYAWSKNVVLVAATGNDGVNTPTFPAGDRGVIGVSATDQSDNFVSFSNYGQDVFLAAPGLDIETTDTSNSFTSISGTSSSAAIVAGVAALMRAVDPDLSNGAIVGRLARNADPAGTQAQTGNGRVNMARALEDTSIDPIQPAGAPGGGPYVGPYVIAASVSSATITIKDSTCTNNKTNFNYGETVCASSSVIVTGGGSVSFRIQWYPPSSTNPTLDTLYARDGPGGGSSTTYYIDETNNPATAGTWTVKVCKTKDAGACPSGNTAASATFTVTPCGNGNPDAGEQCDLGSNNGEPGYCCSSSCQYVSAGIECRASTGVCDVAETCTGDSATCPVDAKKSAGTECRASEGSCDIAEVCDGSAVACPNDVKQPQGHECRASAGECDVAETCNGSSPTCPADAKQPSGTACTDDGNVCTLDQCDGTNVTCQHPAGNAGTVCRTAAGECDLDETCTGSGAACPADAKSTAVCRAAADVCDVAESCDGVNNNCPADAKKPLGTACTDDGNVCTLDQCNGTDNACQHPAGNAGTVCRAATDSCDPVETCTGDSVDCPADIFDICAPIVSNVVATPNPVAAGNSVTLTANINDSTTGNSNIQSAEYKIDDGSWILMSGNFNSPIVNVTANIGSQSVDVYNICVRGTDVANNIGSEECTFLAVYDPSAGFVTGGGWINSPAGAYTADPSLTGKANFGFVSKYKKGATVPTGNTEFQFKVANLNFHSETYQWLVVSGARAQYKGTGTINGSGNYGFLLTAIDGQINGGGGVDKFRIKIWDNTVPSYDPNYIVYDNKMGSSDTGNDATELGGGSIVIHK